MRIYMKIQSEIQNMELGNNTVVKNKWYKVEGAYMGIYLNNHYSLNLKKTSKLK